MGWWSVAAKSAIGGGGQISRALESLVEHGLQSIVKIRAQPILISAWPAIGEVGLGCLWIGDEGGVG